MHELEQRIVAIDTILAKPEGGLEFRDGLRSQRERLMTALRTLDILAWCRLLNG